MTKLPKWAWKSDDVDKLKEALAMALEALERTRKIANPKLHYDQIQEQYYTIADDAMSSIAALGK